MAAGEWLNSATLTAQSGRQPYPSLNMKLKRDTCAARSSSHGDSSSID